MSENKNDQIHIYLLWYNLKPVTNWYKFSYLEQNILILLSFISISVILDIIKTLNKNYKPVIIFWYGITASFFYYSPNMSIFLYFPIILKENLNP